MTWAEIARQDGRLAVQSRSVKVLLGLLVVGTVLVAYLYPVLGTDPITTARFTGTVTGWLQTGIPVVGILLGYDAVASERESGALKLSLALPYSRRDVFLGKFVGRAGLVAVSLFVSLVVAGFLVVYPYGSLELPRSLGFVALTVMFGLLWTGIGVAVSVAVATKRQALVLGFGMLFLFAFIWRRLGELLAVGFEAMGVTDGTVPDPVQFGLNLSPNRAFQLLTDGFITPNASVGGPWYLSEWVALPVFACWLVGPLGVAYRRFARSDLS